MESQLPLSLRDEQQAVEAEIRSAFASVVRGDGVSWSEAKVIDDYGSEEECREARAQDRDTSWMELVDDPAWICEPGVGGFSFIDAQGFRYYIPAAIIRCIRDRSGDFIVYHLSASDLPDKVLDHKLDQWSLINEQQGRAIARFVRLMIAISEHQNDHCDLVIWGNAYNSHWRDFDRDRDGAAGGINH